MSALFPGCSIKEAFPLARSQNKGGPQSLDATGIQLDSAYMREVDLKQVWMPQASLRKVDLLKANLEDVLFLKGTVLRGVKGLTKEQLETCKARGAIIDEDSTTSPSQSTVSLSPSSPSNDIQA